MFGKKEGSKTNAIRGTINGLRTVLKYGAYIVVIIDIITYAIDKLEAVAPKQETKPQILEDAKE